jgi:hypothetical protein
MPLKLTKKLLIAPVGFAPTYRVYANKFAALLCNVFDKDAKLACTTSGQRVIWTSPRKPTLQFLSTGEAAVTNLLYSHATLTDASGIEELLANLPTFYVAGPLKINITSIQVVIATKTHFEEYTAAATAL